MTNYALSIPATSVPESRADYLANVAKVADEWDAQGHSDLAHGMRAAHGIVWPTQDDLNEAVSDFDDGDTSDVLAVSGDLAPMITEARGWLSDCDVRDVDVRGDAEIIHLVSRLYDGGTGAFALANVYL